MVCPSVPLLPTCSPSTTVSRSPTRHLPVPRAFGPWDAISVTRATAEQIPADLVTNHTGHQLTCQWLHDALLIASDPRQRTEPGRLIRPTPTAGTASAACLRGRTGAPSRRAGACRPYPLPPRPGCCACRPYPDGEPRQHASGPVLPDAA
jgi:hypothetical protein